MYNIRDDIIPNGKIDELKKYLDNDIFLEDASMTQIIETLYGCTVSVNNIQITYLFVTPQSRALKAQRLWTLSNGVTII
jgi:hypothetical protein